MLLKLDCRGCSCARRASDSSENLSDYLSAVCVFIYRRSRRPIIAKEDVAEVRKIEAVCRPMSDESDGPNLCYGMIVFQ